MRKILTISGLLSLLCSYHSFAQTDSSAAAPLTPSDSIYTRIPDNLISCGPAETRYRLLPEIASTNVLHYLNGTIPGLQMTHGGGQPGASPEMALRGIGSLNSNMSPLIVLNGIPFLGCISSLNKEEIASITVLKDAIGTARYGSRSAHGLIEILTKNGTEKSRGGKLNVEASFGLVTRGIRDYDMLKSEEDYYETVYKATKGTPFAGAEVQLLGGYNSYNVPDAQLFTANGKINPAASLKYHDDWSKELQRTGLKHDYNLSFADQGKKGNYYLAAGYLNEQGYVKKTDFERFNVSLNGDLKLTPWIKAGVFSTFSKSNQHFLNEGYTYNNPFFAMRAIAPIYPVYYYNASGTREADPITGGDKYDWGDKAGVPQSSIGTRPWGTGTNVLGQLQLDNKSNALHSFIVNPYAEATVLKQLKIRAGMSYNTLHNAQNRDFNPHYGVAAPFGGGKIQSTSDARILNLNQTITWNPKIEDHNLELIAGHEMIKHHFEYLSESVFNQSGAPSTYRSEKTDFNIEGYTAQANYNYKQKYYLSGVYRRDGIKNLIERWSDFWAAGVGYVLSNEAFLANSSWINRFNLRLNYGTQGAAALPAGYNAWMHIDYGDEDQFYNSLNTPSPAYNQWNAGFDLSMFNDKLVFNVDVYSRKNPSAVFATLFSNIGPIYILHDGMKINNSGIELQITPTWINTSTTRWVTSLTVSSNKNRIGYIPTKGTLYINGYQYAEGGSVFDFVIPEYAGVDPNSGHALYYYINDQGARATTDDYLQLKLTDYKNFGSALPTIYGTLNNSLSLGRFDFSLLLNYSIGGKYYDQVYANLMGDFGDNTNWHTDILNSWTPENSSSDIPKVGVYQAIPANIRSSRFLYNASCLNIRNASIAYRFHPANLKKAKLNAMSIYLTSDNIWLFSARKGMDPQATFHGTPGYLYAPARTIMLGVKVGI